MKKYALAALFFLGGVEIFFPFEVRLLFYAYDPQFRRVLLSEQQQQLYRQFHSAMNAKCHAVFYFGVVTIAIGILLLVADKHKKRDA